MSTQADVRSAEQSTGPEDVDHFDCCDPNTAICGYNIAGWDNVPNRAVPTCPLCEDVIDSDGPCTSERCPYRPGLINRIRRAWRLR